MFSTRLASEAASPTRPWPQDQLEHWSIERLTSYANKVRLLSGADILETVSICRVGEGAVVPADEHQTFCHSLRKRANGLEPGRAGVAHG